MVISTRCQQATIFATSYKPPIVATAMAFLTIDQKLQCVSTVDGLVPSTLAPGTVPRQSLVTTDHLHPDILLNTNSEQCWIVDGSQKRRVCSAQLPSDNVLRTVLHISSDGSRDGTQKLCRHRFLLEGEPSTQLRSGASRVPQFHTLLITTSISPYLMGF